MVAAAVSTMTSASDRVDRRIDIAERRSIMRTAVTMSTPARAASGITATTAPASRTISRMRIEWTMAATRVRAPARTLTAVRAIAPVAGMPPKMPLATLARPWPNSSRSGFSRDVPVMPSATRADSRLSIAARAATARAAENSALVVAVSSTGTRGVGTLPGSGPIVMTSQSRTATSTVATAIAMIDAGDGLADPRQQHHQHGDQHHEWRARAGPRASRPSRSP